MTRPFFDIPQHKMAWSICFNALLEQVWIVWTEPILFNTCWPSILPAQQLFCLAFAQIIGCMLNWTWYTGVCGWIDRILAFFWLISFSNRQLWSVCGDNLARQVGIYITYKWCACSWRCCIGIARMADTLRQYAGTSGSSARLLLGSEGSNSSEVVHFSSFR